MKVNFANGVRENLIELNLLSVWDDCTAEAREQHDKIVKEKYNRLDDQRRLDRIFNR